MSYPWIRDSQYRNSPSETGYLEVTSPNGLYLTDGVGKVEISKDKIKVYDGSNFITLFNGEVIANTFTGTLIGNATTATTATTAISATGANISLEDIANEDFTVPFSNIEGIHHKLKVNNTPNLGFFYNPFTKTVKSPNFSGQVFSSGNILNTFSALSTTGLEVLNALSGRTIINSGQITCATTETGTPPTTTITPTSITCSSLGATSTTTITPTSLTTTSLTTSLLTTTSQLTLSNSLTAATFSSGILTCNFNNFSTGIFSATLTADMTNIIFSEGRIGGQYVIYVSATGDTRTINTVLTGTLNRTNYTAAISVTVNTTALLTITFDGTRYLIAGSAFNGAAPISITSATFAYSNDNGSTLTNMPSGGISIIPDTKTYQIIVLTVSPPGATYAIVAENRATSVGQTANIVIVGTGSYDGTITSPNLQIVQAQTITSAIFQYSSNNGSTWTNIPAGGISSAANGTTHQLRVLSTVPGAATYDITTQGTATSAGQTANMVIAGKGMYTGTITSPTLQIVAPIAITDATFEYSNDDRVWTPISSKISIVYDGLTYRLRVASVNPSGATYTTTGTTAVNINEIASISITGNGIYSGTIISSNLQIIKASGGQMV